MTSLHDPEDFNRGPGVVHAGLAWAVEVDPVMLQAHMEVYIAHKPAITTLRLCSRFGHGSIARLPREFVDSVEKLLIVEAAEVAEREWSMRKRCLQLECVPRDHLDEFLTDEWTWHFKQGEGDIRFLNEYLEERAREDVAPELHCSAVQEWNDCFLDSDCPAVRNSNTLHSLFTYKHKEVVLRDFGLKVYVAHHQGFRADHQCHWTTKRHVFRTTLCLLVLPAMFVQAVFDPNEDDDEFENFGSRSAVFSVLNPNAVAQFANMASAQLSRFGRAMRILNLEPCGKKSRCETDIYSPSVAESKKSGQSDACYRGSGVESTDNSHQKWPKLMMLADSVIPDYVL